MRKLIICYFISITMLFLVAGCPKIDMVFPVFAKGSNTLALEKQWWDKNVVELKVLTREPISKPEGKIILPGWIGPCHESEDFGEAPSFDIVWRIRATREVSAQKFRVIPGIVPEGFEQIVPESKPFYPAQGKEYFVLVCLEPVNDSVYFIGKRWTPYPAKQAGYDPKILSTKGPFTHSGSNIIFPERIGVFCREKIMSYAPSEINIGVGYNLNDISSPAALTIYVYPSPAVLLDDHFQEIIQATTIVHPGAKLISQEQISLNQAGKIYQGWKATLEYKGIFSHQYHDLASQVYLFDYDGWSIKYRITCPKKTSANTIKHIDNFMNQFKWKKR